MQNVTVTQRDGRVTQLDQVYVRGPMIRFYIVPDMLQNAPMFKRIGAGAMKGRGIGTARGRATIARATCERSCACSFGFARADELLLQRDEEVVVVDEVVPDGERMSQSTNDLRFVAALLFLGKGTISLAKTGW